MINHHPSDALLKEFVDGRLPVSISVIVASHIEMCADCQQVAAQLTEVAALQAFDMMEDHSEPLITERDWECVDSDSERVADDYTQMISDITSEAVPVATQLPTTVTELQVSGIRVALPRAINSIPLKEWSGLGKVSRARLNLSDQQRRTSLLHIDKGGCIPSHTHNGFEITLLVHGSFSDEFSTYRAGDFIYLDANHTHSPVTSEGCVCLTVSDAALHFTQGFSQLLNPLGKLIY